MGNSEEHFGDHYGEPAQRYHRRKGRGDAVQEDRAPRQERVLALHQGQVSRGVRREDLEELQGWRSQARISLGRQGRQRVQGDREGGERTAWQRHWKRGPLLCRLGHGVLPLGRLAPREPSGPAAVTYKVDGVLWDGSNYKKVDSYEKATENAKPEVCACKKPPTDKLDDGVVLA